MTDIRIDTGGAVIAARDHGGDGPPVLLLHGAGGTLLGWRDFPNRLTGAHRVVSLDLRGHGHSDDGDGDWSIAAILSDLRAVAEHFGFAEPAIVGHSLGGMLAICWAADNPGCPAIVSVDGHRSAATHEHLYAGLDPDTVRTDLAALTELFDGQAAALTQPIVPEQLAALRAMCDPDEEPAAAQARLARGLVERDGHTYQRVSAEAMRHTRHLPEFTDAIAGLDKASVPTLMLLATRQLPGVPPRFAPLLAAHRAGLRRDLAAVRGRRSDVEYTDVDASHNMIAEAPETVARLTLEFLARHR